MPDPYRVWLAEVMLQQTQVETVKPYYAQWLERFPTLQSVADAPLEEVLRAWSGLGYYARARNLHRAAREVVARHGGQVPGEASTFRALPGVGRYTAGAVMSIAFSLPEPVVDGNVRRVFARLGDTADPAEAELWALAAAFARCEEPGDVNQALMELGATVCTPRRPACGSCPLASRCAARAARTQEQRPASKAAKQLPHEPTGVALVAHGGKLLLVRRPLAGRMGGLWEFPAAVLLKSETPAAAARRVVRERVALRVRAGALLGVVEHQLTHVRLSYHAVRCELLGSAEISGEEVAWVEPDALGEYPRAAAQKKLAALL